MNTQTVSADTNIDEKKAAARDWQVISLVGVVHAGSHFFQLVLPSLYISLNREFGYSFVELGLVTTVFFVVSMLGQASSGFIVDKKGGRPVLRFGLAFMALSAFLIAVAPGYPVLLLAAIIGGMGNAVFHPVDFSLLNQHVGPKRLGHAFSVHGVSGNLGWAFAPVFMTFMIVTTGSWRIAAAAAGVLLLLLLLLTYIKAGLIAPVKHTKQATQPEPHQTMGFAEKLLLLLKNPALWGAFIFFACGAIALSSVQNFTVPIMDALYGTSKEVASAALSLYMVSAGVGLLIGGFLAGTTSHTEKIVGAALFASGLAYLLLASGLVLSSFAVFGLCVAGFLFGLAGPSRDMLIRRVAPKGAMGSVYGLVYSGMDVGSALGPVAYGAMLDYGQYSGPWIGAGLASFVAVAAAFWVAYCAKLKGL
ncbi:MFS transporter [Advenella sp. WQ 585]|uniref:MFS transporter n=1 Tax=Advenella mandrilli TaxID=2800330 RepID=A0ABS1EEJ4_9BURK|nr:MFS transporter [Advenella mandrilli]MBK1780656.1 MFS transporter [Advenella mandrilli]